MSDTIIMIIIGYVTCGVIGWYMSLSRLKRISPLTMADFSVSILVAVSGYIGLVVVIGVILIEKCEMKRIIDTFLKFLNYIIK